MSNDKPDYYAMAEGISKTIGKVTKPLTDAQFIALAGAVAVYVEKALAHEAEKQAGPVAGQASAPALGERPRLLTMLPEARAALAALERIACNQTSQDHAEQFTHLREYLLSQQPATPPAPPSESDKDDAEPDMASPDYQAGWNDAMGAMTKAMTRVETLDAIRAARAKKEQP